MHTRDIRVVSQVRALIASGGLRQTREQLRLSQRELAGAAKLPPAVIASWETGRRLPSAPNALLLADALDALGVHLGSAA